MALTAYTGAPPFPLPNPTPPCSIASWRTQRIRPCSPAVTSSDIDLATYLFPLELVMRKLVLLFVLVAHTASGQSSTKRAFTLSDWYRVATVRQPAMSPDGQWVALTVTTVLEAQNKRLSEAWEGGHGGGAQGPLQQSGHEGSP